MLLQVTENLSAGITASDETDGSSHWVARFAQRTLEERRVRSSTLEAYACDIALLSRWAAKEQRSLLRLTDADLARYLGERLEQGAQASTMDRQLYSWRRFYEFLVKQGVLSVSPAAAVRRRRVARHEPRRVPDAVLSRLLQPGFVQDSSSMAAYRARRNHAIVWTLYATGLGVSDVRLLQWPQVDVKLLVISVPVRNGPARSVLLDAQSVAVLEALRGCAAAFGPKQEPSSYCFPTSEGLPLSRQALCQVVRKWAGDRRREEVVTPSMLRQTGRAHQAQRRPQ